MRIAHFSDLHYCPKLAAEAERCFGFGVDQAIERGVDCAVITGDSTDHALDAHAPSFVALARQVRRLADHMPVVMLQGTWSHEPPGTLNVFRLLGGRFPIHVSDRIEQVALTPGGWVASSDWRFEAVPDGARLLLSCVPTLNKAAVAGLVGGAAAAAEHGELIARVMAGFGPVNTEAAALGVPTAGLSHGTVNGCETEHGVPMAGLDHEFTTGALFGARASAFLLGHIHRHQAWQGDGRVIAYPGSIGRFHYGEIGEKGFLLWNVSSASATFEFVPTPAKRTLELSFAGAPDLEEVKRLATEADGAFVRVRWEVAEDARHGVDRAAIEQALVDAGAVEVKLEGRVLPVTRTRAAGIGTAATTGEKLSRWAQVTGQDSGPLTHRLARLETMEPQAIVGAILAGAPEVLLTPPLALRPRNDVGTLEVAPAPATMDLFT